MLPELEFLPKYVSTNQDLSEVFYIPVLSESVSYSRFSAYFSAKAFAYYGRGLEAVGIKTGRYRLVVCNYISEHDYNEIKAAYSYQEKYEKDVLLPKLCEELSLEEEMRFSNLAYLVSAGIVEIKIAYKKEGMFHDKLGLFEDEEGNKVYIHGSNNETVAAINRNYESFDVSISWENSFMEQSKIKLAEEEFEAFWNNNVPDFAVLSASRVVMDKISSYSRGRIITDPVYLHENSVVMDYEDGRGFLVVNIGLEEFLNHPIWKTTTWKMMISARDNNFIYFKDACTYRNFEKAIQRLEKDSVKYGYSFFVAKRMREYINKIALNLENRKRVGLDIRVKAPNMLQPFESYKKVVDSELSRPLREQQMWDSFFMYAVKSAANFSVPGSGKTAAVLGVFAFLRSKGLVKRIVMIGPKSAFISWKDEFRACFGTKQELVCFDIGNVKSNKSKAVKYDTDGKNLILFNYEVFQSDSNLVAAVKELVNRDTLLVFDEVHKVKSTTGKRAEKVLDIARDRIDRYTIALTGTPVPNSYSDIYNLLHLLYYSEYDSIFGFDVSMLKNADDITIRKINDSIQPFFCRTSKDFLGVPKAEPDEVINVEATSEENKLLNIVVAKYRESPLALLIRILQIESDPMLLNEKLNKTEFSNILDFDDDEKTVEYIDYSALFDESIFSIGKTSKFKACMSKAEELLSMHRPTIIWCLFIRSVDNIANELRLRGAKVAKITGSVDSSSREQIIVDFQQGKYDFLVTNPQTLAESVSLHKCCHDAIYFEYSFNLSHMLQSRDRIHRLGLPEGTKTRYYYLCEIFKKKDGLEYSLDSRIYDRLKEKEQLMLEAIEKHEIERGFSTKEDLDIVFSDI